MAPKFSELETEISRLLNAKIAPKNIIITLNKSPKTIYDAIYRIKKKKKLKIQLERASKGRVSKTSTRAKRAINRDLTRSPKKQNKRLLVKNSLDISTRSLQRLLKDEGYSCNIVKKKSILNAFTAKNRLNCTKK